MSAASQVGVSLARRGGLERVTGRVRFGVDLAQAGDLHLHALRAGHGPARIKRLDLTAARAHPGVRAIFTAADIPGVNRVGIIAKVKAWVAGRQGPPVLQPYYDLVKLWRKGVVMSTAASPGRPRWARAAIFCGKPGCAKAIPRPPWPGPPWW
ncbi:MAG: hypothetical protein HY794_06510 [Desulfarculus sp.]|nr:hypothetical protein [Desulfarculus sp.]